MPTFLAKTSLSIEIPRLPACLIKFSFAISLAANNQRTLSSTACNKRIQISNSTDVILYVLFIAQNINASSGNPNSRLEGASSKESDYPEPDNDLGDKLVSLNSTSDFQVEPNFYLL